MPAKKIRRKKETKTKRKNPFTLIVRVCVNVWIYVKVWPVCVTVNRGKCVFARPCIHRLHTHTHILSGIMAHTCFNVTCNQLYPDFYDIGPFSCSCRMPCCAMCVFISLRISSRNTFFLHSSRLLAFFIVILVLQINDNVFRSVHTFARKMLNEWVSVVYFSWNNTLSLSLRLSVST